MSGISLQGPRGWLVTAAVGGFAVAYAMLVFLPGRRANVELKQKLAAREAFIEQAIPVASAATAAAAELRQTTSYNRRWIGQMPAPGQLARLFGRIHELAKWSGTTITRFDPEPTTEHDLLRETPIELGIAGSVTQVMQFLGGIETLGSNNWEKEVELEPGGDGSSVKCRIKLTVFSVGGDISDYINDTD